MKPQNSIAGIASLSLRGMARALIICVSLVAVAQIALTFGQWYTNIRVGKLEKAMTGAYGDFENRVPLTEQAEKQTRSLAALEQRAILQEQKTQEFIDVTGQTLNAIQAVAEIQAGRGGIIKRIEKESKERDAAQDAKMAEKMSSFQQQLEDIKWIIQTQRSGDKGRKPLQRQVR